MAISWRPKEDRLKEDMEKEDERLRFLREPWRWPTGGSFPVEDIKPLPVQTSPLTIGAFVPPTGGKRLKSSEFPWLPQEEIEALEPEISGFRQQKRLREYLPWVGATVAFPGVTAAMGWQWLGTQIAKGGAKKVAGIAGRTVLAPLVGAEKVAEFGIKAVTAPIKAGLEKITSSYLQKLEGHRMARNLGLSDKVYKDIAKQTTGKDSMAKMNQREAEEFMTALVEKGATRDIILPAERGVVGAPAQKEANAIALELSEYLGKPIKEAPKAPVLGKPVKGIREKIATGTESFTQRTYRLERSLDAIDGYPKSNRYNVTGGKMSQTFYNSVNRAEDAKLYGQSNILTGLRNFTAKNNIDLGKLMARNVNIQGVELSADMRMGMMAHTMNPDNLRHIMSPRGNNLTMPFLQDVAKSLSSEERAVVSFITKHWNADTPNVARAFNIATRGKKMKVVDNYVPIVVQDYTAPLDQALAAETT